MAEKTRFLEVEKTNHPLGWACEKCFHMVRDPTPGSQAMKCVRFPPFVQVILGPQGQFGGTVSTSPPVKEGEWCGEYKAPLPILNA